MRRSARFRAHQVHGTPWQLNDGSSFPTASPRTSTNAGYIGVRRYTGGVVALASGITEFRRVGSWLEAVNHRCRVGLFAGTAAVMTTTCLLMQGRQIHHATRAVGASTA